MKSLFLHVARLMFVTSSTMFVPRAIALRAQRTARSMASRAVVSAVNTRERRWWDEDEENRRISRRVLLVCFRAELGPGDPQGRACKADGSVAPDPVDVRRTRELILREFPEFSPPPLHQIRELFARRAIGSRSGRIPERTCGGNVGMKNQPPMQRDPLHDLSVACAPRL